MKIVFLQKVTSADQENVVSCCKRGRTFQQPLRDIGNSERPPEAALKEWASLYCNSRFDVDLWPRIDSQKCDTRRIANVAYRLWTALSGFQWIDCSQCFLHRLPRYVNVSSQLSAVVETGVP
ncbi:Histidine--tRNA ligase [Trichinella pseudospiralis]